MAEYKLPFTGKEIEDKLTNMGGGIVDVAELPTVGDEKMIYRVTCGTLYYSGFAQGTTYVVNELPATGEPCTITGEDVAASYYNLADKTLYGYVTDEIGSVLSMSKGWYPAATLMSALGFRYGGEITNYMDMALSTDHFHLWVRYIYYTYKNGLWTSLNKYEVGVFGRYTTEDTPIADSDYLAITEDFFNTELILSSGDSDLGGISKLLPHSYLWFEGKMVYYYSFVTYDVIDGGLITEHASVGLNNSNKPVVDFTSKTFFPGQI